MAFLGERDGRGAPALAAAGVDIERAVGEANRLGHHYVGTEHLLLALLGEADGLAPRLFNTLDVRPERVRALLQLHKEQLVARPAEINRP